MDYFWFEPCCWRNTSGQLSSPWNIPSLQVPLLEFLPGMGRFGAVTVSVVPVPAPSKDCHVSPVSIRAREMERERERERGRESKRQKENQGQISQGKREGRLLPTQLKHMEDKHQRHSLRSPAHRPKGSRLPPSLVCSSPPDSHLQTFIVYMHGLEVVAGKR